MSRKPGLRADGQAGAETAAVSATTFHEGILAVISALMDLDPPADSPEGRLLVGLAAVTEEYEKAVFPIDWYEVGAQQGREAAEQADSEIIEADE